VKRILQTVNCQLASCRKPFQTSRTDALYCCASHRVQAFREKKRNGGNTWHDVEADCAKKANHMARVAPEVYEWIAGILENKGAKEAEALITVTAKAFEYGMAYALNQNEIDAIPALQKKETNKEKGKKRDTSFPVGGTWQGKKLSQEALSAIKMMNDFCTVFKDELSSGRSNSFNTLCRKGIFKFEPDDDNGGSFDFTPEGYKVFGIKEAGDEEKPEPVTPGYYSASCPVCLNECYHYVTKASGKKLGFSHVGERKLGIFGEFVWDKVGEIHWHMSYDKWLEMTEGEVLSHYLDDMSYLKNGGGNE